MDDNASLAERQRRVIPFLVSPPQEKLVGHARTAKLRFMKWLKDETETKRVSEMCSLSRGRRSPDHRPFRNFVRFIRTQKENLKIQGIISRMKESYSHKRRQHE
jgi:hypothetical protein